MLGHVNTSNAQSLPQYRMTEEEREALATREKNAEKARTESAIAQTLRDLDAVNEKWEKDQAEYDNAYAEYAQD